jgi:hypothetical protein
MEERKKMCFTEKGFYGLLALNKLRKGDFYGCH